MNTPHTTAYDMIIIGAGSGGLSAARFAAQLGRTVVLVEKSRIGGDCTWTGCIPSKALLRAAHVAHEARTAADYGIITAPPQTDMPRVRDYIRRTIDEIYQTESAEQLKKENIDVVYGAARFLDAHTLDVGGQRLHGKQFIIATGAHPLIPDVPGLYSVKYHTYEDIFDNERLPDHLMVVGTGPIGVEIAQAYRRLGAAVTLIGERLLERDEPEAGELLETIFKREGITRMRADVTQARKEGGTITLHADGQEVRGDMLLITTGRAPNVDGLDLQNAGVVYSDDGIRVDDHLRTSAKHIYAIGDCTGGHQFTHYAGWQGFVAVRNALLPLNSVGVRETVPWATFTDPAVARAGMSEAQARERYGDDVMTTCRDAAHIDRAVTDNRRDGFIKLVHRRNGTLLGATVVSPSAGEVITEFALAIELGLSAAKVAQTIHVYPTIGSGVQLTLADTVQKVLMKGIAGKALKLLANRA